MVKIFIVIFVLLVIYLAFFKRRERDSSKDEKTKSAKNESIDDDVMVECYKCETFVSTKDAIIKEGKFYCSKECAVVK